MDAVFNSSMAKVSVVPSNTYEDQAKAEHGSAKKRQCQSPDIKKVTKTLKKELNWDPRNCPKLKKWSDLRCNIIIVLSRINRYHDF